MTRILLIAIAVLILLDLILFLLFLFQKSRAKTYSELYDDTRRRNEALAARIGKMEAAEIIKQEERQNAEEKINSAYSGTASERFDAINSGLQKRANN